MKSSKNFFDIDFQKNLIKPGDKIAVGFSGGPDSVFLVEMLKELQKTIDFTMVLLHINHMIRGNNADQDEDFVINYGKNNNILTYTVKIDVPKLSKEKKMTLEEAGRIARYDYFKEIASKEKCNKIALAHNKDDQIETFLFRMIRGTSLVGLCGIYSREMYIRPISNIYKKDILNYLDKNSIDYCIDSTNLENNYTRNSIRLDLIPFIEKRYNSRFKDKIFHLMNEIKDVNEILSLELDDYLEDNKIIIKKMQILPTYLQKKLINKYLNKNLKISDVDITREKIDNILKLSTKGGTKEISIDKNHLLQKDYSYLFIKKVDNNIEVSKNNTFKNENNKIDIIDLKLPGEISFGDYLIQCKIEGPVKDIDQEFVFYTDLCQGDIISIRYRKAGDTIKPIGMTEYKKVKDIFINEKIIKEKRDTIPVITCNNEILWVVGVKKSESFKKKTNINDFSKKRIMIIIRRQIVG